MLTARGGNSTRGLLHARARRLQLRTTAKSGIRRSDTRGGGGAYLAVLVQAEGGAVALLEGVRVLVVLDQLSHVLVHHMVLVVLLLLCCLAGGRGGALRKGVGGRGSVGEDGRGRQGGPSVDVGCEHLPAACLPA
eukprot:632853-Prorocentrum_minimum.AAC.2